MEFVLFKFVLPILFSTLIMSTSNFSSDLHHTHDLNWKEWDDTELLTLDDTNFRQSVPVNQSCRCGVGMSRVNSTRIVGGVTSLNHSWPWAAAIVNTNSTTPFRATCGASLISAQYLLTAAHCLVLMKQIGLSNFKIYLGGNRINGNNITDRVIASIGAIKIHPAYSKIKFLNDIGLIRLTSPVKYTKNIKPVCLSQTGSPFVGVDSIVEGWGDVKFGLNNGSNSLREVHLKIISNTVCNKTYPGISPNDICAANPKKDFCNGDSGSSLVVLRSQANTTPEIYTQVGIVSYNKNCSGTAPGVFTRVKNYLSFIKFNLKNTTFCSNTFG